MHPYPSNRGSDHWHGGGGRGGDGWIDDRRDNSSGHNNGGYNNGGHRHHHHHHQRPSPENHHRNNYYEANRGAPPPGSNQHRGDYGSNRHSRNESFVTDRGGGVRENDDRGMNQHGNGRGRWDRNGGEGDGNETTSHNNGNGRNGWGRDRSGGGGDANDNANGSKRPASSSPVRRSDEVPLEEVGSAVVDATEEERANRKAFEDCLGDIWKALPVSILAHQLPMDRWNQKENKVETWNEREARAAEATIESIGEELMSGRITRAECESDSDESEIYPPRQKTSPKDLSPMERRFIEALPRCLPLNRGFHVTNFAANNICYCPCGPNVEPWREKHQIFLDDYDCRESFQPNGLVAHLRTVGGVYLSEKEQRKKVKRYLKCMYHYATAVYLRFLYGDWHGPNLSHKALYNVSSPKYYEAADKDTLLLRQALETHRRESKKKEEELEKLRAEMDKLALVKDMHESDLVNAKKIEKIREKFGVEKKVKIGDLSDVLLAKYEKNMTAFFDTMKQIHGIHKKGIIIEVTAKTGNDSGFSLQEWIDNLYEEKKRKMSWKGIAPAHAVLFGVQNENPKNKITKCILSEWKIVYDRQEEWMASMSKEDVKDEKENNTAVDEGGCSRQFLTDVFRQIDKLHCNVGKESVMLFVNTPSGVMVTTDDKLEHDIEKAANKCYETEDRAMIVKKEAIEQAKNYVRAIGRIMLHALANKQTLPNNAMPPFLINVMFHGYDNDYEPDDILNHIKMLAFPGESTLNYLLDCGETDEEGNVWTREAFFEKYIPNNLINTRKILLGSLQDGLTFDEKADPSNEIEKGCGLASHFSIIPVEAIQHTYFAKPEISAGDLIANVIEPKYGAGEPYDGIVLIETGKEKIKKEQEKIFNVDFQKYLRESAEEDSSFLVKFVQCATGSNYLPYDKTFKIYIEFDFSRRPEKLPKIHSCTHEIRIPGYELLFYQPPHEEATAREAHYQKFKTTMNFVINMVYNHFNMI